MTVFFPWYFVDLGDPLDPSDSPGLKRPVHIIPDRFNIFRISDMVHSQIHGTGPPMAASPTGQPNAKRVAVRTPAAQRSERSSLTPTLGRVKKKSQCPKGYYWSYKHKKCMKSKF